MSNEQRPSDTAARLASGIAAALKGAATGGVHGAAIGAAKAFLPQIIKAVVIAMIVLLMLPTLIFAALPNILFGFESAAATDIIGMTDKAYSIDAAYKQVEQYSQSHIQQIIEEATALFAPDDTEVTTDLQNINIYWFIAISSVAHGQDLFTMDEQSIMDMVISKLSFSTWLDSQSLGEGDEMVTINTLKIDITELNPEELMDKLGFTDEERNWAHVLYATMADEQNITINDTDGEGWYNTDYGDITFTDMAIPVVYYNQTDSKWGNLSYGKSGTIGTSGCGPTALAIAVASLVDDTITPAEVAAWAAENGYRCEGVGSYHSLIPDGGAHYGLFVDGLGRDGAKVAQALSDGKLVIAIMSKGHFTSGGHFIVLRGMTADGKILVADPASIKRSNQEWKLSLIVSEANRKAGSGGPFWALSLR